MILLHLLAGNPLRFLVAFLVFVGAGRAIAQPYSYEGTTSVNEYGETAYGFGCDYHDDGQGLTIRTGNTQVEKRSNGRWTRFTRDGNWEYRQHNTGVEEYWFYDDVNQVQKFDIRDPNSGARTIGVNPYPTNPYGTSWKRRVPSF